MRTAGANFVSSTYHVYAQLSTNPSEERVLQAPRTAPRYVSTCVALLRPKNPSTCDPGFSRSQRACCCQDSRAHAIFRTIVRPSPGPRFVFGQARAGLSTNYLKCAKIVLRKQPSRWCPPPGTHGVCQHKLGGA